MSDPPSEIIVDGRKPLGSLHESCNRPHDPSAVATAFA
jgi:hypothetical protein